MQTIKLSFIVFLIFPLVACHSEPRQYSSRHIQQMPRQTEQYGRVSDIEIISTESRSSGGGALLGAVLGGVVGHQLGAGRGNNVATGLGAVGGAIAGSQIEKRNENNSEIYRVTVRLENGRSQQFDYQDVGDLHTGDSVKIQEGQIYRL